MQSSVHLRDPRWVLLLQLLGSVLFVVVKDHVGSVDLPYSQLIIWTDRDRTEAVFLPAATRWSQRIENEQLEGEGQKDVAENLSNKLCHIYFHKPQGINCKIVFMYNSTKTF